MFSQLSRERADLATHLQETEEDLQDVMRKYKAAVSAVTTDQITIQVINVKGSTNRVL